MLVPKEFFKYNNLVYNEKIYRLYKWMNGWTAPPYKFIIVPTNRCNLKCFCCPNAYARSIGRFKEEEELTDERWMRIVKEGLRLGVKEWYILGGGEPMMRKNLVLEIVKMIKENDFFNVCEIITNGTLWEEADVKQVVKLKLDRLLISIDSCDTTHDYLRGTDGAFEKATRTLKYFQKFKQELNSDKPVIQMNSVLNNKTYTKIKGIIDYASTLGVAELALHPMREYEETKELMTHLKLTDSQIREVNANLEFLKEYAKKVGLKLDLEMVYETYKITQDSNKNSTILLEDGNGLKKENKPYFNTRCFEPFYSMFIDPRGNVNFCCAAGDGKSENSINEGVENLWYGPFFNNIRKIIINNGKTEKCEACGLLDMTAELRNDLKKYTSYLEMNKNENKTTKNPLL